MNIKSEKIKNVLIVISVSLASMSLMADLVIIPVAENLFQDFSDVNMGILNYLLSGTSLVSAFSSLLCGKLMSYIGKKKLLIISFLFFMIGGICGDLIHSAYYMMIMRTLVGMAMGGIAVLAVAIISDAFVDEKTRGSVMGIYYGMMTGIGAVLGWISGLVAAIEWTLVFRIYLVSIPILLLLLLFIPESKPVQSVSETGAVGKVEKMPWQKLLLMEGAFFTYGIIYGIIYFQISMVMSDKSMGEVTLIGVLSALGMVGNMLACAFFGLYYGKFKRFTPFVGFIGMALGFFLLLIAQNPLIAVIGCIIVGGMNGLGLTYYMMYCTMIVPPVHIPMSVGITTFVISIASFLSTYMSQFLQWLLKVSITGIIPPLCIVLILGAALSIIMALRDRKLSIGLGVIEQ